MTVRSLLGQALRHDGINFVLTNRIPRRLATLLVGWLSRIEQPVVRDVSIAVWRFFADVDLSDAKKSRFSSMHDCFTRELKEGARAIDTNAGVLVSPCDAIVGASGVLDGATVIQAKGFSYSLDELLTDATLARDYRDGAFVTLRLTSGMYHRFHAPHDCRLEKVTYVAGDAWNVNPSALARVANLYCKNERAILQTRLSVSDYVIVLVPVAAVLVASIRLAKIDVRLHLRHRGPNVIRSDATFAKGEELGWFEQGSTIIVFAPKGFALHERVHQGAIIRMGQPLMRLPADRGFG